MIADILYAREQLFICPPPGTSHTVLEDLLAEDFIELGSSGKTYDRADGIKVLTQRAAAPPMEPWEITGFAVRSITNECCLVTYILNQPARIQGRSLYTRRATLWRLEDCAWRAVYHQGTVLEEPPCALI